jgi:hypothetical protein
LSLKLGKRTQKLVLFLEFLSTSKIIRMTEAQKDCSEMEFMGIEEQPPDRDTLNMAQSS